MQLHHISGNRSRTRNQKSPTPLKLQGSLTGFLVSSVHQPRVSQARGLEGGHREGRRGRGGRDRRT